MKAQVISMDFVMTFVVYIFALSIFFIALQGHFTDTRGLDLSAELMFNKLANVYDEDYSFLEGPKIDPYRFGQFLDGYDEEKGYLLFFTDFEDPGFKKIDYCIFIENRTPENRIVLRHFAAWRPDSGYTWDDYDIKFRKGDGTTVECGRDDERKESLPFCTGSKAESILLSKPVLYGNDIMELKVLICGEKV